METAKRLQMFDEAKQLEQRAGDVWAYIDMWDYGHSSLLQFEERCCHRVRKEAVKLFAEIAMVLALDVFNGSEGNRKRRYDSPIEPVATTFFVLFVQQNIKHLFLCPALGLALQIPTPHAVEVALAQQHSQPIMFTPAVRNVFLPVWQPRRKAKAISQNERQKVPVRVRNVA
jgi:hypothetical protein